MFIFMSKIKIQEMFMKAIWSILALGCWAALLSHATLVYPILVSPLNASTVDNINDT